MGTIYCANCGSPVTDDSAFCMVCGSPVAADASPAAYMPAEPVHEIPVMPAPASGRNCPFCGFAIDDDSVFCCNCGHGIAETAPAVPEMIPEQTVIAEPLSASPEEKKCPSCGSPLDDDAKFCCSCGQVLEEILRRCSCCNAIIAPGSSICAVCGIAVGSTEGDPVGGAEKADAPVCAPATAPEPSDAAASSDITEKERRAAERNFHKPPKL